jgi:hypothetical protein
MQDYEAAKQIIRRYKDAADFEGRRSEKLIRAAEKELGLQFPPTYRRFLLEYGVGGFGGSEIYGVIHENFRNSGVPVAIWYTLTERKDSKLPGDYVVIYNEGTGTLYCLDTESDGEEAPVVTFVLGLSIDQQEPEVVAEDFGAFFRELVETEAEELE